MRDLDLVEDIHNAGNGRTRPWSAIMADTVLEQLGDSVALDDDPGKAKYAETNQAAW